MNDRHQPSALVGAWRLVSWENQSLDGNVTYPMGADALGYLIYTADGRVSVTISRAGRPASVGGDLLGATTEERARAVEGFVAYAGRYTYQADRVVHHVELSLFPDWVKTDQERSAELSDNRLTLSAGPMLLAGKQQMTRLVWERVDPWTGAE
jgi:lipocalin-like protein